MYACISVQLVTQFYSSQLLVARVSKPTEPASYSAICSRTRFCGRSIVPGWHWVTVLGTAMNCCTLHASSTPSRNCDMVFKSNSLLMSCLTPSVIIIHFAGYYQLLNIERSRVPLASSSLPKYLVVATYSNYRGPLEIHHNFDWVCCLHAACNNSSRYRVYRLPPL